jgi:hypothetical protein
VKKKSEGASEVGVKWNGTSRSKPERIRNKMRLCLSADLGSTKRECV